MLSGVEHEKCFITSGPDLPWLPPVPVSSFLSPVSSTLLATNKNNN